MSLEKLSTHELLKRHGVLKQFEMFDAATKRIEKELEKRKKKHGG